MFYTYILKSQKDGRFYYGSTSDIETRLKSHNGGKVRSTKSRRPLVLHYQETFDSKTEAIRRETFFKSIDGYNFLKSKGII
jgi:putative endonuclease